jgi:exopolysaccharide production protein ExoZ
MKSIGIPIQPTKTVKANLAGIQILRAVAAIFVLFHHVLEESLPMYGDNEIPRPIVLFGACGVDLFFVISGFIMMHTTWDYFGQPGGISRFLRKRFFRIFPIYWLCIIFILLAKSIGLYKSLDLSYANFLYSLTLIPLFHDQLLLHGVAWTLVFEMYFYYVFAAWIKVSKPLYAAIGMCISLVALMFIGNSLSPPANSLAIANPIIFEFCLGLGIALLFRYSFFILKLNWLLLLLGLTWLSIGTYYAPGVKTGGIDGYMRFFIWGVPSALIVCSVLNINETSGKLVKYFVYLGSASYSLYLFHPFVMTSYAKFLKSITVGQMMAPIYIFLATVMSLALGVLVYQYIEKPLLKLAPKI